MFNRYYNLLVRAEPHLLPDFCTGSSQGMMSWDAIVWLNSFLCRWQTLAKFQPNHCALPTVYHVWRFLSAQMKSEHLLWYGVSSFTTSWQRHSSNLTGEVDASTSGTRDHCQGVLRRPLEGDRQVGCSVASSVTIRDEDCTEGWLERRNFKLGIYYCVHTIAGILRESMITYPDWGFPCFFFFCKANARVKPAKTDHGLRSSKMFMLFCVLFVLCRSVYCVCVCVCV